VLRGLVKSLLQGELYALVKTLLARSAQISSSG